MDCSLPGSSLHGILRARVLEWVAISFSRGSSRPRDRIWDSRIPGRSFNLWATRETLQKGHFHQEALSDPLSQLLSLSPFFAPWVHRCLDPWMKELIVSIPAPLAQAHKSPASVTSPEEPILSKTWRSMLLSHSLSATPAHCRMLCHDDRRALSGLVTHCPCPCLLLYPSAF